MSRAPDLEPKRHRLNSLNYNYSKLKKEEVIYKGLVYIYNPDSTALYRLH